MTTTDRIVTFLNGAVMHANMGEWANVTGILTVVLAEIERMQQEQRQNFASAA